MLPTGHLLLALLKAYLPDSLFRVRVAKHVFGATSRCAKNTQCFAITKYQARSELKTFSPNYAFRVEAGVKLADAFLETVAYCR